MGDERLRDLERRWRETGSVEDEAALLRERLRVGVLTEERLQLAAHVGHEAARRIAAVDTALPDFGSDEQDQGTELWVTLSSWLRSLCSFGLEVGVRAALACSEAALPDFERLRPEFFEPSRTLDLVRAWLLGQDDDQRQRVVQAGIDAELAVSEATLYQGPTPECLVGFAPSYCALALADEATLVCHASEALSDFQSAVCHSASTVAVYLSSARAAELVSAALLPWALGYGDPVLLRVTGGGEPGVLPGDLLQ